MVIARILNRLLYPHTYSSDGYIDYIRKRGGIVGGKLLYI